MLPGCKQVVISHAMLLLQFKVILMKQHSCPNHIMFRLDLVFGIEIHMKSIWKEYFDVMIKIPYLWLSQHIRYNHKLYTFQGM